MTDPFIQSSTQLATSGRTISTSFPNPTKPGSFLLAIMQRSGAAIAAVPTVQLVSDGQNKWKQVCESSLSLFNNRGIDVWICENPTAGYRAVVTAELCNFPDNPLNNFTMLLAEYTGGGPEMVESVAYAKANDTSVTLTTPDIVSAGDLLVHIYAGNAKPTPPSGATLRQSTDMYGIHIADSISSASSHANATWTFDAAKHGLAVLIALKPGGCKSPADTYCVQMRYHAPGMTWGPQTSHSTTPALPVTPDPQSTVIALVTPNGGATIQLPAPWTQLGKGMGLDTIGGVSSSMWAISGASIQGLTEISGELTPPVFDGLAAWTLVEYLNAPTLTVFREATSLMFPATCSPQLKWDPSAHTPAPYADLVLAYANGQVGYYDGLALPPGCRARLMDSNGSAVLFEVLSRLSRPVVGGFSVNSAQGGSMFATAIGGTRLI